MFDVSLSPVMYVHPQNCVFLFWTPTSSGDSTVCFDYSGIAWSMRICWTHTIGGHGDKLIKDTQRL